jgi:23S rRNA pseudouridine1911/1915/1917 synthase
VRLDQIVSRKFSLSRRKSREYVESGRVEIGGVVCMEPGAAVEESSEVRLDLNRPAAHKVRTRLTVFHEDDDLLMVEKPAGLLTLPTEGAEKDTLLSRVNSYLQHRFKKRPYAGVVHRLDKETSGVLVFARNRETLRGLQELFKAHQIERVYLALVEGNVVRESGTAGFDLVRDRGDRRRGVARRGESGLHAVTHFEVKERLRGATLLALKLETGRTHQIRVHMAALGHPVVGDRVYRPRTREAPSIAAPRQMLHAARLALAHPGSGKWLAAESPLPEDFRQVLERLRQRPEVRKNFRGGRS